MRRQFLLYTPALLLVGALFVGGCSNALETGYVPRALGASSAERRGYYASPFTPEAAAAEQAHAGSDSNDTHPTGSHPGGYR